MPEAAHLIESHSAHLLTTKVETAAEKFLAPEEMKTSRFPTWSALSPTRFCHRSTPHGWSSLPEGRKQKLLIAGEVVEIVENFGRGRWIEHAVTSAKTKDGRIAVQALNGRLAGAGELADARTLAARLLAYDASEATRAQLQMRLARAGQSSLLNTSAKGP